MIKVCFLLPSKKEWKTGGVKLDYKILEYLENRKDVNIKTFILPNNLPKFTLRNPILINLFMISRLSKSRDFVFLEDGRGYSCMVLFNLYMKYVKRAIIVGIIQEDYFKQAFIRAFYKKFFSPFYYLINVIYVHTLSRIVVNSEKMKSVVLSNYKISSNKIFIAHPGFEFKKNKHSFPKKDNKINLLFVGQSISWRKGLIYLVEAMSLIDKRNVKLHIVGEIDNKYFKLIQRRIEKYNLSESIKFYGYLNTKELASRFVSADIFILPSIVEAFGIVLLEAMSFKLPIVTTNIITPELIENGKNGIIVPSGDSKGLANAIQYLIDHPELREGYGEYGYNKIKGKFTWEKTGEVVYKVLKGIARSQTRKI